ncbi:MULTISPECIES: hypothetical protein [unclassified Microbacterium]|uniref:hypothetical protein n=1 Tax=unclassified Microbacterium TaxID=2609290 RepID=UPI000EA9B776|nr:MULTISPECIES: hypothetical protein [unclassified Microbacterium]MBT2484978.1 hypothetical protein [Microbacterium sp. ISL-108]RKN69546.1 hypothetical protein D7252_09695 [Microbacterium sp. CGR2]
MTSRARVELAAEIEEVVRATAGVRNVYRSGSLISNLLRAGAAALGTQNEGEPMIAVVSGERGVVVEASIGIDSRSRAAEILRAVHEAIDERLSADGLERDSITLSVVYVQSPEAT